MTARLVTITPAPTPPRYPKDWDSQGLIASAVVSTAPAHVLEIRGVNTSASTRYVQMFNATSVPADAAVPYTTPIPVAPGGTFSLTFPAGLLFSTGVCVATSSTAATKAVGAAELWCSVTYK